MVKHYSSPPEGAVSDFMKEQLRAAERSQREARMAIGYKSPEERQQEFMIAESRRHCEKDLKNIGSIVSGIASCINEQLRNTGKAVYALDSWPQVERLKGIYQAKGCKVGVEYSTDPQMGTDDPNPVWAMTISPKKK